jgi:hypothetical protein
MDERYFLLYGGFMSKFHFVISFVFFLSILCAGAWGQSPQQSTFVATTGQQESGAAQQKRQVPQAAELASDLQRMRVLVNQMQVNLGFVQTTDTPLRHQFELEIEMWQVLIEQMERRLESSYPKPQPSPQ